MPPAAPELSVRANKPLAASILLVLLGNLVSRSAKVGSLPEIRISSVALMVISPASPWLRAALSSCPPPITSSVLALTMILPPWQGGQLMLLLLMTLITAPFDTCKLPVVTSIFPPLPGFASSVLANNPLERP